MSRAGIGEVEKFMDFFVVAEKLKCVKRDCLLSDGDTESTAEHSWMLGLMVLCLAPKMNEKVDLEKCLKLALVHDLPEAKVGDVSLYASIDNKEVSKKKKEDETEAIDEFAGMLSGDTGEEIRELWLEYEEAKTPEAKLVMALDKLEATFQALRYKDIRYWERYEIGRAHV